MKKKKGHTPTKCLRNVKAFCKSFKEPVEEDGQVSIKKAKKSPFSCTAIILPIKKKDV